MIPRLKEANISFLDYGMDGPTCGIRYSNIQQAMSACTFTVIVLCPAITTKLNMLTLMPNEDSFIVLDAGIDVDKDRKTMGVRDIVDCTGRYREKGLGRVVRSVKERRHDKIPEEQRPRALGPDGSDDSVTPMGQHSTSEGIRTSRVSVAERLESWL